jgi:hypothetical protein
MEERSPVIEGTLNKQWRTADKGWSSSLRVGRGANNSPLKNYNVTKQTEKPRIWTDSVVLPQQRKSVMSFD